MKIYGNEYEKYILEILKGLMEGQSEKGISQSGTDQTGGDACKTQDE